MANWTSIECDNFIIFYFIYHVWLIEQLLNVIILLYFILYHVVNWTILTQSRIYREVKATIEQAVKAQNGLCCHLERQGVPPCSVLNLFVWEDRSPATAFFASLFFRNCRIRSLTVSCV